jgi:hypothetical protein
MTTRDPFTRRALRAFRRRLGLPWRPTDVDGCLLWLRASSGVSTTFGLVTRWRDRARGNAMESRGALDAPAFIARAPAFNDHPAIRFGGTGERLESARGIRQPLVERGLSVFAVISPRAPGSIEAELLRWSGWTADVGIALDARSRFVGRIETRHDSGVHLLRGRPYLIGLTFEGTTATLWVNRARARTIRDVATCETGVEAPARICLGAERAGFRADVGEVVVYDHALSQEELDALSAGLLLHYGFLGPRWLDLPRTRAVLLGERRS